MSEPGEELRRRAEHADSFGERMEARRRLHRLGLEGDPWSDAPLLVELDRAAKKGAAAALADAGRTLLAADRLSEVSAWLTRLDPLTGDDREAVAVVQGLLAIRDGVNADAIAWVAKIPHPEAVALHGLALLQLGEGSQAAARLEVLLAADALDERGELPPAYLPGATPVLALFATACISTANAHLRGGRRDLAKRHATAVRDARRRYSGAELDPEVIADLAALLEKTGA